MSYNTVAGHELTLTALPGQDNHYFLRWEKNGVSIGSSPTVTITVNEDSTIVAVYGEQTIGTGTATYYTVAEVNDGNLNQTQFNQVLAGVSMTVRGLLGTEDYILEGIYKDGIKVTSDSQYTFFVNADTEIRYNYRPKKQCRLTVQNGVIPGVFIVDGDIVDHITTGIFKERANVHIIPNTAPSGSVFSHWEVVQGDILGIYYDAEGEYVQLNDTDVVITARYKVIRNITIIKNSSTKTYEVMEDGNMEINANPPPNGYVFNHWNISSGDVILANAYSSVTKLTAKTTDSTIEAVYELIPTFDVTMIDGYIVNDNGEYVTSATLPRGASNIITLKQGTVPLGQQFNQWTVYNDNNEIQPNANDVLEPLAETTQLRYLTRNIKIKAVFDSPNPVTTYAITVHRKDGSINSYFATPHSIVDIEASDPDTGKRFERWTGDVKYISKSELGNVYEPEITVEMPNHSIELTEHYVSQEYVQLYDLVMVGLYAECRYTTESTDPDTGTTVITEHWTNRHEYEAGEEVTIRLKELPDDYYFGGWNAIDHATGADAREIIDDLDATTATITMPECDIDCDPIIVLEGAYQLRVNEGGTSGIYKENAKADIYFGKVETDDVHYDFTEWAGSNVDELELYDGGHFVKTYAGDINNPQFIKMPAERTEVTPIYKTLYRLTLHGGTIGAGGGGIPISDTQLTFIWNDENSTVRYRDVIDPTQFHYGTSDHSYDLSKRTLLGIRHTNTDIYDAIQFYNFYNIPDAWTYDFSYDESTSKYYVKFYDGNGNLITNNSTLRRRYVAEIFYDLSRGYWRVDNYPTSYTFQTLVQNGIVADELYSFNTMNDFLTPNAFKNGTIYIEPAHPTEDYYEAESNVDITADEPIEGTRCQYWEGDTDKVTNKYDPSTSVETVAGVTELRAVYSVDADRNSIGYATMSLKNTTTVNNADITVIAGQIEAGFILTDSIGHIYVIISVDNENNTSVIYKMTKTLKGGNIYV